MPQDPWAAFAPQQDPFAAFNPQEPELPNSIGDMGRQASNAMGDYSKRALTGAMYAGQRTSAGLTGMLPSAVRKYLESKGLSPTTEQLGAAKEATVDAGIPGMAGQMAADVGMQMLPSSMLSKATAGLTTARGVAAELAGQGGINAALTPDSEGRGMGAAIGAGGAATGMAGARILGGPLRTAVSAEGRKMLDAGIPITPGQAISGPNAGPVAQALRTTEDKLGSIPLLGDVIRTRARGAANAYSNSEINLALKPIKQRVEGVGHTAIDSAMDKISSSYTHALPDIHVPATSLPSLVDDAIAKTTQQDGFFNEINEKVLRTFENTRLLPLHGRAVTTTGQLTGVEAKKLDQEIGEKIRDYRRSGNVQDTVTVKALVNLRDGVRTAMVGATPEARQLLKDADAARANIQPILDVAHATTGEFTAGQLVKQIDKNSRPSDLQRAAASVLPATTPDSGTAGRALLAKVLAGGGAGAGVAGIAHASLLPAAVAAGGAMSAYTKPGMTGLTEGIGPIVNALRAKQGLPKVSGDELEQAIQAMMSQGSRSLYNTTQGQ